MLPLSLMPRFRRRCKSSSSGAVPSMEIIPKARRTLRIIGAEPSPIKAVAKGKRAMASVIRGFATRTSTCDQTSRGFSSILVGSHPLILQEIHSSSTQGFGIVDSCTVLPHDTDRFPSNRWFSMDIACASSSQLGIVHSCPLVSFHAARAQTLIGHGQRELLSILSVRVAARRRPMWLAAKRVASFRPRSLRAKTAKCTGGWMG